MSTINAFSVDLEDWFQAVTSLNAKQDQWHSFEARVEGNTKRLLKLLEKYDIRATFFVLGHVAKDYPELIQELDAAGHEIGVHGYWHKMVHRMTPEEFDQELERALEVIQPLASQPVIGHRAPYFSINGSCLWALDVLRDKGFKYDSSFFPTRNTLYGYPGAPRFPFRPYEDEFVEFPMSTAKWGGIPWPIAGGFYMRAFPYVVIKRGLQQLNGQGHAAILYMHPWELDAEHRYHRVTLREWIVQYTGRGRLEDRLSRLFSEFKFAPLGDLVAKVDA